MSQDPPLCTAGREGTLTGIPLFVVATAPYGTIDYDVGTTPQMATACQLTETLQICLTLYKFTVCKREVLFPELVHI